MNEETRPKYTKRGAIALYPGDVFGRLTLIRPSTRSKYWVCVCSCGKETETCSSNLRVGKSKSCGCLNLEKVRAPKKHGNARAGRKTGEYYVWMNMRERCNRPANAKYAYYGGRGIRVCDRWQGSFQNFLDDIGHRPTPLHTIERINNDGNYEPGNCRWATRKEQCANFRQARMVTFRGETLNVAEWSRRTGIASNTIISKLNKGLNPEIILTAEKSRPYIPRPNGRKPHKRKQAA